MFDRIVDINADPSQLAFRKDDILFIDNTMYNGVPGNWSAWIVDVDGKRTQWGIIPSKYKVEEELLMKRSLGGDMDSDGSRRPWATTRRSFFKRKKGGRSSSRESKELASYSDMGSLSYSDSGTLHEDPQINSYIRVERLDCEYLKRERQVVADELNLCKCHYRSGDPTSFDCGTACRCRFGEADFRLSS